jgi:small subunit ribosomal protein S1
MSWTQHVKHPSKILSVGDTIEAVILSVDKENEKISLGLKQLEPDPWLTLDVRYPVGAVVKGKVRNLTTFGAFVEIEDGIDGLVHISDMSWTKRIQHPSEIMKKNDEIEVKIMGIDKDNRRISLGHKQVKDDPWPELELKYAVNTETLGTITRLLDRGVIVELEGEVEGFVPTNKLGKPDISKPAEAFSVGDSIPLRVIEFDSKNRRIILSVDAYYAVREQDELDKFIAKHPTRSIKLQDVVEGSIEESKEETKLDDLSEYPDKGQVPEQHGESDVQPQA